MPKIHDYKIDVVKSENQLPDTFYTSLFGSGSIVETIPADTALQIAGADKRIVKANGESHYIEEKVRWKDYGDMLLETKSCLESGTDGWIKKASISTYLIYYVQPIKVAYIFNLKALQAEYEAKKDLWHCIYEERIADNGTYNTLNLAVPFGAIKTPMFEVCI